MVMSKDKDFAENSGSPDDLSDKISDGKTTYVVIDSVGDCDDIFENCQLDSDMTESGTFDNGIAGKQSVEISHGPVNNGKAVESLTGDMEVLEDFKSQEKEYISIPNGTLEIPLQKSNSPPSKTDQILNFVSHGGIKNGLKDCVVNCSMREEEVESKIKKLKACDETKSLDENKNCSNSKKADANIKSDLNEISHINNQETHADQNCCTENFNNELNNDTKTNKMFCSTPLNNVKTHDNIITKEIEFEDMSPLVQPLSKTRNLKRKNLKLESIQEDDEDSRDSISEKKMKIDNENEFENVIQNEINDLTVKVVEDTMTQYEAPAKSILKKWQPSFTSRNASTSSAVHEENGEEEDDFEVACKSLTEELNKCSNIDALEKESQMDDDKFEEIWRELNEELGGDKTSLTLKSMDEQTLSESNRTLLSVKSMLLNDSAQDDTNDETLKNDTSSSSSINVTVEAKGLDVTPTKELSNDGKVLQPRENTICERADKERTVTIITKAKQNLDSDSTELNENTAPQTNASSKLSDRLVNKNDQEVDEEDMLLGNDKKDKPYHFVEYVSEDPQENEDNYNPEWKRLGELTNDEERYRAVRDRWRSLIPPDPNKDLTCRQWRERNKLPPNTLNPVNNNYHLVEASERTEPCTAVFDMKIESIMGELESTRRKILSRRNIDFEELAKQQDKEQQQFIFNGGNNMQFAFLHKRQLEQCRQLKLKHDNKIRKITTQAEQKIKLLRDGCNEVELFQKFYKGVGENDEDEILYMTSTQVQELVETEEMLESYESLYTG